MVQSSFTQLKDTARHRYPDLPMHWITSNNFRSIDKVPHLKMPKLFIHGTADQVVPYSYGETLFRAAAEPKASCGCRTPTTTTCPRRAACATSTA